VRPAVGHQHGGQRPPHSGQGHDAAVHLVRRIVDDLARLWHGHAAGADARAAARAVPDRPAGARRGRESGLTAGNGRDGGAPLVLLAAGGTGGHLFPAEALAGALMQRGLTVDLATDKRAERYGGKFPARDVHLVPSETLRGRNPLALARTSTILGFGILRAYSLLGRLRPAAVVGFGGYPTIPP